MDIYQIKSQYMTLSNRRDMLVNQLKQQNQKLEELKADDQATKEAIRFLEVVADEAQSELKADVDGLVTMAVQSIFGEAYAFDLKIDRTNTNAPYRPVVLETVDGVTTEYTPKDEMGGSMVDPIAFIFRVVLRSLDLEPCRATFWLDEPMKNMGKGQLLINAAEMLREVSHSLGLQLIIITHEDELALRADRAWRLTRPKGRTQVELIHGKPKQKRSL